MKYIGGFNRKSINRDVKFAFANENSIKTTSSDSSLGNLIKNNTHRHNLLLYIMTWICASFTFYLTYFLLKYLKGDVYLNCVVAALSEMAGYLISGKYYNRLGIKRSYLLYFSMGFIGSLLYLSLSHLHENLVPILLLFTVYGISASCMTNWLSNARLFPVIYASSTHGIASFFARLTNIMVSQVAELDHPIPLYFISGFCLIGLIVSQFMITHP